MSVAMDGLLPRLIEPILTDGKLAYLLILQGFACNSLRELLNKKYFEIK
jgi:hypothetical protein